MAKGGNRCRKRSFTSRAAARRAQGEVFKKGWVQCITYRCPTCRWWHIGHRKGTKPVDLPKVAGL